MICHFVYFPHVNDYHGRHFPSNNTQRSFGHEIVSKQGRYPVGSRRIDVYLVTGFFGSGKTTFVNNLLARHDNEQRIAVLVNDFGDVGVDSDLISIQHGRDLQVHDVAGGSIFCSCRHWEFIDGLHVLAQHEPATILVEASGMADPSPMQVDIDIATRTDPDHFYFHAGTTCLVDASMFLDQLDLYPVAHRQVEHATLVVVNKVDLLERGIDDPRLRDIMGAISRINDNARIELTRNAVLPVDFKWIAIKEEAAQEIKLSIHATTAMTSADRSLNQPDNQPGKVTLFSKFVIAKADLVTFIEHVKQYILRIKGFCLLEDGWYNVDGVSNQVKLKRVNIVRDTSALVIVFDATFKHGAVYFQDIWHQLFQGS